ncbi:tetratricopeptide repeat protein [Aestuariibacter salexigens]|uniref:tetratricopeptide repeat protein n=1 Tax=Aestuariibacter salexigens TaxID=226010 RepID=UPI000418C764|nr:sel1 repeat family protein [Aestuariibacter salexigens]
MKLLTLILCCLVAIGVSSSDCRSVDRLLAHAQSHSFPAPLLYRAVEQGSHTALQQLTEWAIDSDTEHWLQLAADSGSSEAQHHLALVSTNLAQQRQLFMAPANAGHAPSQHELALLSTNSEVREYWLTKSAQQNYQPAVVSLANWLLLNNRSGEAKQWLEQAANFDAASAMTLVSQRWRERRYDEAMRALESAIALGSDEGNETRQLIERFWQRPVSRIAPANANCTMKIQPVVTNLSGIAQAVRFITQFASDERVNALPICLGQPVWQEADYGCDANFAGGRRLGCSPAKLAEIVEQSAATHIVMFAEHGKANVHNGIMYLDQSDTYDVFIHELAHFVGFADEYPISGELAASLCRRQDIPNLVFMPSVQKRREAAIQEVLQDVPAYAHQFVRQAIEDGQVDILEDAPLIPPAAKKWSGLPFSVSVSKARTCNNDDAQAFKPVSEITFLEHHDSGVIPPFYRYLWEQRLQDPRATVPVYVNLAQYFESVGDNQSATLWWQRYQAFRTPKLEPQENTAVAIQGHIDYN